MTKIIATLALLFVMFTNLNATETPTPKNDTNCTVEKCKTKQTNDTNCTAVKCKKNNCTDCDGKGCEKCKSATKTPTWSATQDANSSMNMRSCCKNKKKVEAKEKAPMKCGQGKCGAGKCGGGK